MRFATFVSVAALAVSAGVVLLFQHQQQQYDQAWKAEDKLNVAWNVIVEGSKTPSHWLWIGLVRLIFQNLSTSFDRTSDWMPTKRNKIIHRQGVVAKFAWEVSPKAQNLTGLFKSGTEYGIIRASLAIQPIAIHIIPGLAFKMFRDGIKSANFMAMYSLDGQNDLNFFAHYMKNHVPQPKLPPVQVLAQRFKMADKYATKVGLSNMAMFDASGRRAQSPVVPYLLTFVPNPTVHDNIEAMKATLDHNTWHKQFDELRTGDILYRVYLHMNPTEDAQEVAVIRLRTPFTSSYVGDQQLFFQHQRFEEDLELRPELEPWP